MGARLGIKVALAALVIALVAFGLRQYGNARVQEDRAETLREVAAEAVALSTSETKADAQVAQKKAASVDSVRSAVRVVRRFNVQKDVPIRTGEIQEVGAGGAGVLCGAEFSRVLNDAITETNAAIASSGVP
jgi:translation initiation factor 2 alpha subunit (eIF-2alpha)